RGSSVAKTINLLRSCWHAAWTAGATLATVIDPPETGAGGSAVSPSSNRTLCTGRPSVSAATCVITVYVPVPRSCDPDCTSAEPSGSMRANAVAGLRCPGYVAVATPQPICQL